MSSSSLRPPQLHLSLPGSTTSFKRSFDQFGFDLESPVESSSSSSGDSSNKRARSEPNDGISGALNSSMASGSSSASSSSASSSSSLVASPSYPPALSVPIPHSSFDDDEDDGQEDAEMADGELDEEEEEVEAQVVTVQDVPPRLPTPQGFQTASEEYRLSLERFHAFDSQIAVLRRTPSPPPPTLPPLTLDIADEAAEEEEEQRAEEYDFRGRLTSALSRIRSASPLDMYEEEGTPSADGAAASGPSSAAATTSSTPPPPPPLPRPSEQPSLSRDLSMWFSDGEAARAEASSSATRSARSSDMPWRDSTSAPFSAASVLDRLMEYETRFNSSRTPDLPVPRLLDTQATTATSSASAEHTNRYLSHGLMDPREASRRSSAFLRPPPSRPEVSDGVQNRTASGVIGSFGALPETRDTASRTDEPRSGYTDELHFDWESLSREQDMPPMTFASSASSPSSQRSQRYDAEWHPLHAPSTSTSTVSASVSVTRDAERERDRSRAQGRDVPEDWLGWRSRYYPGNLDGMTQIERFAREAYREIISVTSARGAGPAGSAGSSTGVESGTGPRGDLSSRRQFMFEEESSRRFWFEEEREQNTGTRADSGEPPRIRPSLPIRRVSDDLPSQLPTGFNTSSSTRDSSSAPSQPREYGLPRHLSLTGTTGGSYRSGAETRRWPSLSSNSNSLVSENAAQIRSQRERELLPLRRLELMFDSDRNREAGPPSQDGGDRARDEQPSASASIGRRTSSPTSPLMQQTSGNYSGTGRSSLWRDWRSLVGRRDSVAEHEDQEMSPAETTAEMTRQLSSDFTPFGNPGAAVQAPERPRVPNPVPLSTGTSTSTPFPIPQPTMTSSAPVSAPTIPPPDLGPDLALPSSSGVQVGNRNSGGNPESNRFDLNAFHPGPYRTTLGRVMNARGSNNPSTTGSGPPAAPTLPPLVFEQEHRAIEQQQPWWQDNRERDRDDPNTARNSSTPWWHRDMDTDGSERERSRRTENSYERLRQFRESPMSLTYHYNRQLLQQSQREQQRPSQPNPLPPPQPQQRRENELHNYLNSRSAANVESFRDALDILGEDEQRSRDHEIWLRETNRIRERDRERERLSRERARASLWGDIPGGSSTSSSPGFSNYVPAEPIRGRSAAARTFHYHLLHHHHRAGESNTPTAHHHHHLHHHIGGRMGRRGAFAIGDFMRDEDFDESYEGLLSLASMLGEVKPRATPEHVITGLDTAFYKDWASEDSDKRCPICLDDYKSLDPVLKLPDCGHWLHKECLQQWLRGAATCPVCRKPVKGKQPQPPAGPSFRPGPSRRRDDDGPGPTGGRPGGGRSQWTPAWRVLDRSF